jgi:hypothetical protein
MLKKWLAAWNNWLGDRDLQLAIYREVARLGYADPRPAVVQARLEAIERPGWVQVWSFLVEVRREGEVTLLYGTARDDGRRGTKVVLALDNDSRNRQLALWCQGLIRRVDRGIR